MSSASVAVGPAGSAGTGTAGHPARVAWGVAAGLAGGLLWTGLRSGESALVVGVAGAFLLVAVAWDVRSFRVPNWLTLPSLLAALLVSPWAGGTSGPLEALLGALLGFGLLLLPYAIGGMGAGDVKALMALGAWLGPAPTLGAAGWALLAAGGFGLVALAVRGELLDFARRWGRIVATTLGSRRIAYAPPAPGTTAARGIPFAAALAVGLAAWWTGGVPW